MKYRLTLAICAALMLPATAMACEKLTGNFTLCTEGTPWAKGNWVSGGDSDTLYLGDIAFEGFEDYGGSGSGKSLAADMAFTEGRWSNDATTVVAPHVNDQFRTKTLNVYRTIETVTHATETPTLWVTMIASGGGNRIMMTVRAPAETPVDQIDQMSRDFATLIRPAQPGDS